METTILIPIKRRETNKIEGVIFKRFYSKQLSNLNPIIDFIIDRRLFNLSLPLLADHMLLKANG
jgi:hypothetical protein